MKRSHLGTLISAVLVSVFATACGKDAEESLVTRQAGSAAIAIVSDAVAPVPPADQIGDESTLAPVLASEEIPYPVYPNSSRYRIGGENDLKIVLFQTEDSFDKVDAYYRQAAETAAAMPRLSAMNDYVRYSASSEDADPWETGRPGIVIHTFNSETERLAVGADTNAMTNIIMSFQ